MIVKPEYVVIIPARLESQRLPGKVLLAETGKPLIQHVAENIIGAAPGGVHILAEGSVLANAIWDAGLYGCVTPPARNGMERIGRFFIDRAGEIPDDQIIVHLQADEPEFPAKAIERLAARVAEYPLCDFATAITDTRASSPGPHVVPVLDIDDDDIYTFFRSEKPPSYEYKYDYTARHCGAYAYRAGFAKWYASLAPSNQEVAMSLEQMRAMDSDARCAAVRVDHPHRGIDTRQDYDEFVARWKAAHP